MLNGGVRSYVADSGRGHRPVLASPGILFVGIRRASFTRTLPMWRLSEQAQDLVDRLHHVLSAAPWLDRAKYDASVTVLIDQIRDQGEPAALAAVARCLLSSSRSIRIAASRAIQRLMCLVAPEQLIHLNGVLGSSWGWYVSESWDRVAPENVSALLVDAGSRAAVLGLFCFHRNGYVRHEAVRLYSPSPPWLSGWRSMKQWRDCGDSGMTNCSGNCSNGCERFDVCCPRRLEILLGGTS